MPTRANPEDEAKLDAYAMQLADAIEKTLAGSHEARPVDPDERPIVSYFAFEERTAEGVLPQSRPVGAPSIPGVLMSTVSEDGIWTRGAMALEGAIPNVQVPFTPGFDPAIVDLTAENVTGLDVVTDGDRFHAVWGSADGTFYATGSTDPNATEQVEISQVTRTPPVGPSTRPPPPTWPWPS